jgi:predicted DsbA family dithiol-disulfide isomerase
LEITSQCFFVLLFSFNHTGNTFNSHRIILAAKEKGGRGLQDQVVEQFFKAYFEDEQSIGEDSVLLDYSKRAGMDVTEILADDSKYRDEVIQEMKSFGAHCRGVPFFIIDNKFALSGAQEAETLLDVFQQACK